LIRGGDQSAKQIRNEWWQDFGKRPEKEGSLGGRSPSFIGECTFCLEIKLQIGNI
jgi:hypothetical protein